MHYGEIKNCDIANGEGVRISLFVSGCTNHCENCFQPQTWNFDYGKEFTEDTKAEIFAELDKPFVNGLTVLGGEPFEPRNQRELLPLLREVKAKYPGKTIWCFTGFRLDDELLTDGSYPRCEVTDAMLSCIDVLVDEPKPISPLIDLPQCVLTPHLGADTQEAQDNVGIAIAEEVIAALRGEMVPNAVNLPALQAGELAVMKNFLTLGEDLGKLYYQLEHEAIEKVEVIYSGALAEMETSMITRAVLKGVFEPILKERVNYVNAEVTAGGRGVEVIESKENTPQNLLTVKIYSKGNLFTAAGNVTPEGDVRIKNINGYQFDVEPMPFMLAVNNEDKPGMIGQLGTLLGAARVNIATMQVSRNLQNGVAMMLMTVDNEVVPETLKLLQGVTGFSRLRQLKM